MNNGRLTPRTISIAEVRRIVKATIIAQGGKFYNFNSNNIQASTGCSCIDIQNAMNYFRYSPQQAKFRAEYNI